MKVAALADIADINPRLTAKILPSDPVAFVPMAAVSAEAASDAGITLRPYSEVARGYTAMSHGDLLIAKITPCFENGKIALASLPTSVGFGSTEFHVVRANTADADARYLLHFLRQPRIRVEGERRMTGSAGQRRVPAAFLSELTVPLPPSPNNAASTKCWTAPRPCAPNAGKPSRNSTRLPRRSLSNCSATQCTTNLVGLSHE